MVAGTHIKNAVGLTLAIILTFGTVHMPTFAYEDKYMYDIVKPEDASQTCEDYPLYEAIEPIIYTAVSMASDTLAFGTITDNGSHLPWRIYDNGHMIIDSGIFTGGWISPINRPWDIHAGSIHEITIAGVVIATEDLSLLFFDLPNLRVIHGLGHINTHSVTSMFDMFSFSNNLQEFTLGVNFLFASDANLPNPPRNETYTGFWTNVGTGTVINPQGTYIFTADELMAHHNADPRIETWVWQQVPPTLANYQLRLVSEVNLQVNEPITWAEFELLLDAYTVNLDTGNSIVATPLTLTSIDFENLNFNQTGTLGLRIYADWATGQTDTQAVKVNIVDTIPPVITIAENRIIFCTNYPPTSLAEIIQAANVNVVDNYDSIIELRIAFVGTTFEEINWVQGSMEYGITVNATDSSGNSVQTEVIIVAVVSQQTNTP
ncbi:MAG: hypothetical protein FWE05_08955 [Defluviitaleaceae bacterium]|nr:hypothetical protein [Defluviitaleaceae bacterium]